MQIKCLPKTCLVRCAQGDDTCGSRGGGNGGGGGGGGGGGTREARLNVYVMVELVTTIS